MKDTFRRIQELGDKDSQPLREEYKVWVEDSEGWNKHPHVLYMNQINPNS